MKSFSDFKLINEETPEQEKARKELDLKLSKWKNQQRAAKTEGVKQVRGDDGLQYEETDLEEDISVDEEFHVVANKSYYGDKSTPVKVSSHKTKDEADAALAKHKANKSGSERWHKTVDSAGLKKHMNEDVEQIDEISKNLARKYYRKASNQAMDSIVAKDNPLAFPSTKKDHEKTLNKRIAGMKAAGRRLDNRVPTSEEIELDETYRLPSDSEVNKVKAHVKANHPNKTLSQVAVHRKTKEIEYVVKDKDGKMSGHSLKEENLDEISKDTLNSYVHKAFQQGNDIHYDLAHSKGNKATDAERAAMKAKLSKRNTGVIKAAQKLRKEDMDEAVTTVKRDASGKVISWSHEGDWEKMSTKNKKQGQGKAANLSDIARRKSEKMSKEEVELDEAASGKDKMTSLRQAHDRHMEKALAANKAGDDEATKAHQRKMQMIQGKMQKLKQNEEVQLGEECEILFESHFKLGDTVKCKASGMTGKVIKLDKEHGSEDEKYYTVKRSDGKQMKYAPNELTLKEEVEQIDELSKKTLGSYAKKASDERAIYTAMAVTADNGSHNKKEFSKNAAKRGEGLKKAVDKLTKEEVEELDELDKKTLGSYVSKSHDQLMKHTGTVNMKYGRGDKDATAYALDKDALRKTANRTQGMKTALNKLTKEDTEPMLTYAEFMAQLAEGKADDLRDKLAADRERRLNNYDYSKEKDHKPSNVKKVKGHSYGAGEDNDEDESDVKPAKPEAAKRGRGRPAGSKSGARV